MTAMITGSCIQASSDPSPSPRPSRLDQTSYSRHPNPHPTLEPVRTASSLSTQSFALRPRSNSHHLSTVKPPSRRWLLAQAHTWRFLMGIGMLLHDLNNPRPPKPAFVRHIPIHSRSSKQVSL